MIGDSPSPVPFHRSPIPSSPPVYHPLITINAITPPARLRTLRFLRLRLRYDLPPETVGTGDGTHFSSSIIADKLMLVLVLDLAEDGCLELEPMGTWADGCIVVKLQITGEWIDCGAGNSLSTIEFGPKLMDDARRRLGPADSPVVEVSSGSLWRVTARL
jgi:hypothetical protein